MAKAKAQNKRPSCSSSWRKRPEEGELEPFAAAIMQAVEAADEGYDDEDDGGDGET